MESATQQQIEAFAPYVRSATMRDARAIGRLLQKAHFLHAHPDWFTTGDWVEAGGFMLLSEEPAAFRDRLFGARPGFLAGLAAGADVEGFAWVRKAAVRRGVNTAAALAALLQPTLDYLRKTAVAEFGWLLSNEWPLPYLPALGFQPADEIEIYVKENLEIPPLYAVEGLEIHPVKKGDIPQLATIDTAVFDPMWRYSAAALHRALLEKMSFKAAWHNGRIVGFQLSARSGTGAHLARLTVARSWHGRGVGSALLADAIEGYRAMGLQTVSLNTQTDNSASQALYRKFGFQTTGTRYPIWTVKVIPIMGRGGTARDTLVVNK